MSIFRKFDELLFGQYPCCDFLNRALRYLLKEENPNEKAINEICWAIFRADGYFFEDVEALLKEKQMFRYKREP